MRNGKGCPAPQDVSLQQRLEELGDSPVILYLPRKTLRDQEITEVTSTYFVVSGRRISYHSSFALSVSNQYTGYTTELEAYQVRVKVRGIGSGKGTLEGLGTNFVEIKSQGENGSRSFVIPLNKKVRIRCIPLDE